MFVFRHRAKTWGDIFLGRPRGYFFQQLWWPTALHRSDRAADRPLQLINLATVPRLRHRTVTVYVYRQQPDRHFQLSRQALRPIARPLVCRGGAET